MKVEFTHRQIVKLLLTILVAFLFILPNPGVQAQRTLISDDPLYTTPHTGSVLDIHSTGKGLLIPRLPGPPSSPTGGMIYYNTTNNKYWQHNGSGWVEFMSGEKFWTRLTTTQIHGIDLLAHYGIGTTTPGFQFHMYDPLGSVSPQLTIENSILGNGGNTSIGFLGVSGSTPYTVGVDRMNGMADIGSFKIQSQPTIKSTWQGDLYTHFRSFPSGIVDLNNQSRARAYQSPVDPMQPDVGQPIPPGVWTPIIYDRISYDQQSEFFAAPVSPTYFQATEEGYYQVNARIDFLWMSYDEPQVPINQPPLVGGYVSIAIIKVDVQGVVSMYAQGNKLQGHDHGVQGEEYPQNGLAPNVSDVVYCAKGDQIFIYAWQSIFQGLIPLRLTHTDNQGLPNPPPNPIVPSSQVYVSIHKVS